MNEPESAIEANEDRSRKQDAQFADWSRSIAEEPILRDAVSACMAELPPRSRVLDFGGGTGQFAAWVAHAFPQCTVDILDPSAFAQENCVSHPRVRFIRGDARTIQGPYDLIVASLVLHHVLGVGWNGTVEAQRECVGQLANGLSPDGRMLVFEQAYNGFVAREFPGRLVHRLTTIGWLVPLIRNFANTAGIGVAFHSERAWREMIRDAQLSEVSYQRGWIWRTSAALRLSLLLKDRYYFALAVRR